MVTIAAVSGAALGDAAELMLSCNVLVASTRALFGEGVDAEQALRLGLVQRVVAPEDLIDEALAMAGRIASERTASRMARRERSVTVAG
jgi:enoyl-CoA hydratase/carnithine racemase